MAWAEKPDRTVMIVETISDKEVVYIILFIILSKSFIKRHILLNI
jgi:hypothetical protein